MGVVEAPTVLVVMDKVWGHCPLAFILLKTDWWGAGESTLWFYC